MTAADAKPNALAEIQRQVMWNRLIAVVEEQAQVLLRTAFGAVTREAGDLSAGVYDLQGRMLAQAVTGTPGHVNTMAMAAAHFLTRFPIETMQPGDVFATNDPWMGTGHLFDFVVLTPAFRNGRPVALFASTCHLIDVGGVGFSADATSVFEEGICVPHMKLMDGGHPNEVLFEILATNVRNPVEVRGDIMSLVACNEAGCIRLVEMMNEFALSNLDELGGYILENSRTAALAAVAKIDPGTYRHNMTLDGYEEPVTLMAAVTIGPDGAHVDYDGSSAMSRYGINSPICYSDAYTGFGLKCIIAPDVPNNAGSLAVFTTSAPEGTIVNPPRPAPVTARHVIGQMLPDLIFGCLHQALPDGVPAEGAGSIWVLAMAGDFDDRNAGFNVMSVSVGGVGARPHKDGLSSTAFPSGVGAIPVEVTEAACPLVFWRRELLPDSGGPGQFRGGLGQIVEIGNSEARDFTLSAATFDRLRFAARGRDGGAEGSLGSVALKSGPQFTTKSTHTIPAGDRVVLEIPGAGGFGAAVTRDPQRVAAEVAEGLVTRDAARDAYAVVLTAEGAVDALETDQLRASRSSG